MDTATTIATAPAILAMVTMAKDLGLPSRLAGLVAVLLGVGLSVAEQALSGSGAWEAASSGLILGLAAAGVYDAARLVSPAQPAAGEG